MNKQLSYISIIYFLCRAFFVGIGFSVLIKDAKQDAWISLLVAFILGFVPVLLISYISSYKPKMSLKEKYENLFPILGKSITIFTTIGILLLASLSFWNLSNFITSQFLNKTPKIIIGISFIIPILLLLQKEEKIIPRVSLILFYLSMFLFLIGIIGLIFQIDFQNFLPILENDISKPITAYIGFQILPIFLILFFPNNQIQDSIKKGYILSSISIFIHTTFLIGILTPNLAIIYQYPEFHILKRAYQGILTYRLENALSIQWIFDIFIYCVVSLKGCNDLMGWNKNYKRYIFPIIMLVISNYLFKDNTIANTIIHQYLSYLVPLFFSIIILLLSIKIFIKKRRSTPIYSTVERK